MIAEGVAAVGNDGDLFRNWLYSIDGWEGVGGSLTIDSNGDPAAGHKPRVIVDGKSAEFMVENPDEMAAPEEEGEAAGEGETMVEEEAK